MINALTFDVIGHIHSPYKEKFAIPRQPGLVTAARGELHLSNQYCDANIVKGLDQFSHIWVIFAFHGTMEQGWNPMVRPPRLGGNEKVGVFSTRSTFRPNPIGMSVVKLDKVVQEQGHIKLLISGLDLLDQTPVLDIKPYIPYADAIPNARAGFANTQPSHTKQVMFSQQALDICNQAPQELTLQCLIEQVLSQDPRPAYKKNKPDDKQYGIRLYHYNISWKVNADDTIKVLTIESESNHEQQSTI